MTETVRTISLGIRTFRTAIDQGWEVVLNDDDERVARHYHSYEDALQFAKKIAALYDLDIDYDAPFPELIVEKFVEQDDGKWESYTVAITD